MSKLAIDGGVPVRSEQDSSPTHNFGEDEIKVISQVIKSGVLLKVPAGPEVAAFQDDIPKDMELNMVLWLTLALQQCIHVLGY